MLFKIKFFSLVITSAYLAASCGNNTSSTTSENSDSSTSQSSNITSDTGSKANSGNMAGSADNMMPMNSMMNSMKNMKLTGDFDIDFANMMIEHHQGALDMAQVEISQGKDETMKSKAQEILTKQKDEQQQLRDFVSSYKASGMKHGEGALQKSMSAMMNQMTSMKMSGDVDKDFATMMMQHHEHGIEMAKMEVKNGMSAKLKKMAQISITEQQKDNSAFKSWLSNKQ